MTETLTEAIEAIVTAAIERQHVPGLSIAVAHRGSLLYARGFGNRNVGEALPADPDTIYSIASISKQFTAAAIMQLAERGELNVNDRVGRYFPWHPYGDSIQLRHLLTHTSGMPDYFPLENLDRIGFTPATPREIAELVLDRPAAFAPGTDYQYCNTAYVLLGELIESIAEQSYAQYLQSHFFDPLGMTRTGVDDTPAIRSNVAVGYTSFALGAWELARDYHPSWEFGTGGLYSTVSDMLRWNAALRSGSIVRATSLQQMTTPVTLTNGLPVTYGFGLSINDVGGYREIRHTGGLPGISTDNTTYPDDELDIVVFTNHDGLSTYATITRPILALILGRPALRGAKAPDLVVSSGLHEHPDAQRWIRTAAAGGIDDLPVSQKFGRFLTPARRAQFVNLRQYGAISTIARIDAARRDPETTTSYRVEFARGPLIASIAIRDDGTIADLRFSRWDDRA